MFADIGYEEAETKGLGWIEKFLKLIIKRENLNCHTSVGMKLRFSSKLFIDIKITTCILFI